MANMQRTTTTSTGSDGLRQTQITTTTMTTARPVTTAKNLIINRTVGSRIGSGSPTRTTTGRSVYAPHDAVQFQSGQYQLETTRSVSDVKSTSDREKKDMQDLNDRFANYIDKVGEGRLPEYKNWPLGDPKYSMANWFYGRA